MLAAVAAALAACAGNIESGPVGSGFFSSPSWSILSSTKDMELDQSRPVAPEDFVDASGRCAGVAVAAAGEAAAGDAGSVQQPLLGGVALSMTECQVAQRAGTPAKIDLSADEEGERKVVLTYLAGNWPGIYTFRAGRLKEIERVAAPPPPAKPVRKRKAPRRATNPPAR